MEYVYQQQPFPASTTGVPVTLSVIDSNNNFRTIGTTTTDTSGTYAFTWTPDIPGNYTLIASFAGSNSYYGSTAETHIYASSPAATPAPAVTAIASSNLIRRHVHRSSNHSCHNHYRCCFSSADDEKKIKTT